MIEALSQLPLWQLLCAYVALAFVASAIVLRTSRVWMRAVAARSKALLHGVLAEALPRPLALSVFVVALAAGAKWLPLPTRESTLLSHLVPFASWTLVVIAAMRVVLRAITAYGESSPDLRSSAGIGRAATWIAGLAIIAVIVSDALGVSLAPALTALGVGSLAMALALQDTLSNFFAGLYLLIDRPLRPTDFVRLEGGQEGYVETIGWRSTHLRTLAGSFIIVPNATLSKAVITNFRAANPRLVVETRIDLASDVDVDRARKALADEAARAVDVPGVLDAPAPYVRLAPGITETGLAFTLYVKIAEGADAGAVQDALRTRAYARAKREGLALAGPAESRVRK
jgi:small-conductance mechanosensitive channel